jgi:hypothetical protein
VPVDDELSSLKMSIASLMILLPAGEADRPIVTVLFANLNGFMTLSEHLDPRSCRRFRKSYSKN